MCVLYLVDQPVGSEYSQLPSYPARSSSGFFWCYDVGCPIEQTRDVSVSEAIESKLASAYGFEQSGIVGFKGVNCPHSLACAVLGWPGDLVHQLAKRRVVIHAGKCV